MNKSEYNENIYQNIYRTGSRGRRACLLKDRDKPSAGFGRDNTCKGGTEGTIRVKAEFPDYSGPGHALKGETEVTDMQACIFEDGVMTHIFKGLEPGNGTYDLQVGRLAGTLYLLANTDGLVDLEGLKGEGITEHRVKTSRCHSAHPSPATGML